ncbi:TetR/AcrR family transcriptional regulator [Serratia fonticola]|uniref:TetR/AcrR family transcriptional regulator n=1 Tax=Serratia fonticola TaxID=47917 RepID=UPI000587D2DD|nr:TetR/AcrR family transcriptional regulator [Serratia fonticola]MBC3381527.1 TetR/AcrR family transcriptional regulator [Serratia fonticola]NYA40726.1 TetR/AcrR family transcriptional regulator [Serratia fonticola]
MSEKSAKERILDASETLFNKHGFHAVGIDRIQDISGVSKVTMYKHFGSKKELILAVLIRRDERFRQSLSRRASESSSLKGKINAVIDWHLEWFNSSDFNGCMFVSADKEFGKTDSDIKAVTKSHKSRIYDVVKGIFDDEGVENSAQQANILFLLLEGAITVAAVMGGTTHFEGSRQPLLRSLSLEQPE